ncbi:MAG: sulfur carrier protein ThiS [Ruminococcus sp.]|nr:sulfur carrier protein ThiS [Ruminococcus sp.]
MVKVNGEMMDMDGRTVAELLEKLDTSSQRVAVEVNGEIVPRATYGEAVLKDGDSVEVVRFVGGG